MENKTFNVSISTGTIWRLFIFGLVIFALWQLRELVLIILTSIVIASVIDVLLKRFSSLGRFRTLSVVLIYLIAAFILFLIFYFLAPIFISELSDFLNYAGKYLPKTEFFQKIQSGQIKELKNIIEATQSFSLGELLKNSGILLSHVSGSFFQTIAVIFGGVLNLIFIVIISFYLAIQEHGIENFLRIIVPGHYENYAVSLWQRTERKIALWVRGQLLLGILVGVLIYLGLSIFGVKYAFLLALVTAIFELIPFGLNLAAIPILISAYASGGFSLALIILGFLIIIGQFETYLFIPFIIKKSVGISPFSILVALLAGGMLAGLWGVVLAIPVAVAILEFLDDLEKKKQMAAS